ncbi:MAG: hypothetical protein JWN08_2091 [Frankiales bacterium]|nr:hypothetical protein [Frankiales bacterium]
MTADDPSPVAAPAPATYRIDPARSSVGYSGKHMFGLGTVHATFTVTDGELSVTDPPEGSTARVTIDAASFRSGVAKRDRDVRSAGLLDVEHFPTITFRSDGLRQEAGAWRLGGQVVAHGTASPVEVVVDRVEQEADGLHLHGRAEHVDRHAFGVTGSRGLVGRYLDLDLDVRAVRVG